ncbi:MAG: four helix bundle protein [Bacteroidia bacterium]|nr:four helix bundle protein [Bacteroidia bacterium]MBP7727670.1 four helix bundle protein [Bacteroidia bacterium]MBP7772404.1 four helix bundle protein [Bacteroidia bacterium]
MATIERFEDLRVWQQARLLAKAIYLATGDSKLSRDFVLRDQMRRAVVTLKVES